MPYVKRQASMYEYIRTQRVPDASTLAVHSRPTSLDTVASTDVLRT